MSQDVQQRAMTSFKILRLRLLRPPPASISLGRPSTRRPVSVPITLAIGITDDYGVDFDQFDSLFLKLEVVNVVHRQPIPGIALFFANQPRGSSVIEIQGYSGPYYTLKGHVVFSHAAVPKSVCVALSSEQDRLGITGRPLSDDSQRMLEIIGESRQAPFQGWDGSEHVLMRAFSGPVEINISDKVEAPVVSSEKVQTIERLIHLPPLESSPRPPALLVVERPGLNNSTGQRLWDCAIGISCWLSLQRKDLFSASRDTDDDSSAARRPNKMARLASDVVVIELGAGSGLASLTCARLAASEFAASSRGEVCIISTDVEATVHSTLAENLKINDEASSQRAQIHSRVLDWGHVPSTGFDSLLEGTGNDNSARTMEWRRLVLGADILYNPSSHQVLLDTLLSVLRPHEKCGDQAYIAYKRRTDGDDRMFDSAREAGLTVHKVWQWGEVSIWQFRK